MNYYYCNDFPFSLAKGGKENQLEFVKQCLIDEFENIFDLYEKDCPQVTSNDIIHFFGDSTHFLHIIKFLKGKGINPILVISPNFIRRKPLFYRALSLIPRKIPNWYSEREELYGYVSLIIVNSKYEKTYLKSIFTTIPDAKIKVVKNTFSININNQEKEINSLSSEKYFLMISHLSERKNIFSLISAANKFYLKYNIKLFIVGGMRFHNENSVDRFNNLLLISPGINYLGVMNGLDLETILKNCYCHILPSYIESPGLSNLEAASFNKPIIVGDFPVLREYFGDSANYCRFSQLQIFREMERFHLHGKKHVVYDLTLFSNEKIKEIYIQLFRNVKLVYTNDSIR
jgi:glycosyltransferase involved in cell wall biosynthesis